MSAPFDWLADWQQPLTTKDSLRVLGIDLGTTNSTITEIVWEPGSDQPPRPEVIDVVQPTHLGQEYAADVVPSVVALTGGAILVGEGASRLRGTAEPHLTRNKDIFWECKNEIGTRRTYRGAPDGFKTPRDIASHVLRFLHEAALDYAPSPIDRVVITVPASFGWEQRQDTFLAAEQAGLHVRPGDLLDEPVAAFLDYLSVHGGQAALGRRSVSRLMVLDFGGGTCDVAILEARAGSAHAPAQPGPAGGLGVSRLGVSRFHRIGGGDLDTALALKVLLPQLVAQNADAGRFSYSDKRDYLLPALTGVAAVLKMKQSELVRNRRRLGRFDPKDPALTVSLPGVSTIPVGVRGGVVQTLRLAAPSLTYDQFVQAAQPFLSRRLLMPRGDEYLQAQSVFAPVADVLQRSDLEPGDIDACLLVGGSSLLPLLADEVEKYLPDAAILTYKESRDALRCVGRGAAVHALLLAAYHESPLSPTTGDAVSIRTRQGLEIIVPRNAPLPYPAAGRQATRPSLRMATGDGASAQPLTLQVMSGISETDARTLSLHPITVQAPVRAGDPIELDVSVDENQRLSLRAEVQTSAGPQTFTLELDNPFSVVVNPDAKRERIRELEEQADGMSRAERIEAIQTLARLHWEIGERERAREYLERVLPMVPAHRRGYVLNLLGIISGELGDTDAQVEYYQAAAEAGLGTVPLFNLAIALLRQGKPDEALLIIDDVVARDRSPENHALRGRILDELGRDTEARAAQQKAIDGLHNPRGEDDFVLSWVKGAADAVGDEDKARSIKEEQARRRREGDGGRNAAPIGTPDGLPDRA